MVAGPGEHGADGLPGTGEMWSLSLAVSAEGKYLSTAAD